MGILFAIAFFLFAYRGYDRKDDQAGDLACLFALGVALLPGTSASAAVRAGHFASATALFLVLAYFSYFLFTKHGGSPTAEKLKRNRLYRGCARTIVACILAIGLYLLAGRSTALSTLKPVFWLESIALWAFGLSWLTKGETLWQDPKADVTTPARLAAAIFPGRPGPGVAVRAPPRPATTTS